MKQPDSATMASAQAQDNSLEEIWADDVLNRQADAIFLHDFLVGRVSERRAANAASSFVLNLNASWGEGKTFFLERFQQTLAKSGYVVASINAWKDDNSTDPLLSVMAGIDTVAEQDAGIKPATKRLAKELGKTTGKIVVAGAKGLVKQTARRLLGESVDDIIAMAGDGAKGAVAETDKQFDRVLDEQAKKLLGEHKEGQKAVEQFKAGLKKFVDALRDEDRAPLFVLIDELDRCRPTYAIALLERIKHLFLIEDIVFVIATDTEQLRHAINAVYGTGFDSKRYLNRFFDVSYSFDRTTYGSFADVLISERPIDVTKISLPPNVEFLAYFSQAIDAFGLSLRDSQQAYDLICNVVTAWKARAKIEICALTPFAICHVLGIPISANTAFSAEIKARAEKARWSMKFGLDGYGRKSQQITGWTLFQQFMSLISNPLPKVMELDRVDDLGQRWIVGRLQEEFLMFHGNVPLSSDPPYSVIRRYPQLVRSAGRLS